jgi:hypothetical protein
MEGFLINTNFNIGKKFFKKGEFYICDFNLKRELNKALRNASTLTGHYTSKAVSYIDIDSLIKRATKDGKFSNLLIIRFGGIGDIIALTSIIDYFEDKQCHFITKGKYFPIFDWFYNKPKLYSTEQAISNNLIPKADNFRYWARLQAEQIIEMGSHKNWMEVFFDVIGEYEPDKEFLRPSLRTDRINDNQSNIQRYSTGRPSLLICNKATIMMRTCHASDIIENLPNRDKFDIFVYKQNLSERDKRLKNVIVLDTDMETFLLDCYDADMVISVDTGALHFREGIEKPAIGLYNSFTTDSRTKYYQFTKSYDLKSDCELQPCFLHENVKTKFCPKGNIEMFAAPCFDSRINKSLKGQLKEILKEL